MKARTEQEKEYLSERKKMYQPLNEEELAEHKRKY
jgi:hypothetical protein